MTSAWPLLSYNTSASTHRKRNSERHNIQFTKIQMTVFFFLQLSEFLYTIRYDYYNIQLIANLAFYMPCRACAILLAPRPKHIALEGGVGPGTQTQLMFGCTPLLPEIQAGACMTQATRRTTAELFQYSQGTVVPPPPPSQHHPSHQLCAAALITSQHSMVLHDSKCDHIMIRF